MAQKIYPFGGVHYSLFHRCPFCAIIRRLWHAHGGNGLILYFSGCWSNCENLVRAVLEPYAGMWIASVVLLPLGIYLTRKSTADSPLLDAESWGKFFSKINILDYLKPLFKKDEDTTNMQ